MPIYQIKNVSDHLKVGIWKIDESTEESFEDHITKADFRKKFDGWCKEHKHRALADSSLNNKMKANGIESGKKHFSWMYDGKGGDARVWLGIEWK